MAEVTTRSRGELTPEEERVLIRDIAISSEASSKEGDTFFLINQRLLLSLSFFFLFYIYFLIYLDFFVFSFIFRGIYWFRVLFEGSFLHSW